MLLEVLSSVDIATDLIERTSSTRKVYEAVQLSLAPAFLLVGIGSIMNVMMARLNWIASRIERLEAQPEDDRGERYHNEFSWLCARRHYSRRAIMLSSSAAVIISVVIALLFVSTYIDARIGTIIAVLWVATVAFLIAALFWLVRETRLAAQGSQTFRK